MFFERGLKWRTVTFITVCAMGLSACEPLPNGANGVSRDASASFKDTCAPLRAPFEEIRAERNKIIGKNVVGGALGGALLGALLGDDKEDIIAGVVVGVLAGAARAYAENAQSRGATESSLVKFANSDARREAAQNDKLVNTLLRMNACRLDQLDLIASRARKGEISVEDAKSLVKQVRKSTRKDNRVVNSVAGNRKTYDAYVGVLSAKDVAAADRTRASVANYQPSVRTITRTSRGQSAINAGGRAGGATNVAAADNSLTRMNGVNDAHGETVDAAANNVVSLLGNLDEGTPT